MKRKKKTEEEIKIENLAKELTEFIQLDKDQLTYLITYFKKIKTNKHKVIMGIGIKKQTSIDGESLDVTIDFLLT